MHVIGAQRGEEWPLTQSLQQHAHTIWREDHIVVEKHQPRTGAAELTGISSTRDGLESAGIARKPAAHDAVHNHSHTALRGDSGGDIRAQRPVIRRQHDAIDHGNSKRA
jgi:hypothetical protein